MARKKTVYVSQEDIRYGCRGSDRFDPVGNALHRQGFPNPVVTKTSVKMYDGTSFKLPEEARSRVKAWDDGFDIAPFQFQI